MPLDVQAAVYDAVWAALEGFPPFANLVEAGNRRKSTDPDVLPDKPMPLEDTDLPQVRIDVAENTSGERAPITFDDGPDYGVPMTLNVDIKVVFSEMSVLADQTAVEAAIRGGLQKAGRKLGIKWVTNFVDRGTKRRSEKSPDTGNVFRPVSNRRLVIYARPLRSLLTDPTVPATP